MTAARPTTPAPSPATLLRSAWVFPMDSPAVRDGGVLVGDGKVLAVGPSAQLRRAAPHAVVHDFGDAAILPGLVNPHTHLELSRQKRPENPGRFIDWLGSVLASAADASATAGAVAAGIAESLRFGVTTVGDISRDVGAARAALGSSRLRAVSFGEVVGMARRRSVLPQRLAAAVGDSARMSPSTPTLIASLSPHSPYSIDAEGYRSCIAIARQHQLPLTTHLAESPDETAFLSDHAGPFRELWDRLGEFDDSLVPFFPGGPVRFAASVGLLDHHSTALAHVNYCDDDELSLLARGRASVVYCPRTHAYFGHPPHRWRDMLAAGINVAVGTDSRASSPDLNPVDDLRLLHAIAPEVPPESLWEMATFRAARALGLDPSVGSLTVGHCGDVVVFPAIGREPLRDILESSTIPTEVWIAGEPAACSSP